MHLLHAHILKSRKDPKVYIYRNWPQTELGSQDSEVRLAKKLPGYPSFDDKERFFLFDEGHTTYWDKGLWLAFKDRIRYLQRPVYVIVFCTYGNEETRDHNFPIPPYLIARMTLDCVTLDNRAPRSYGLRLSKDEFKDVLDLRRQKVLIDDKLSDFIYKFTRGHVGHTLAVMDFLVKKVPNSQQSGNLMLIRFVARG
jgi:hypothetical protein